MSKSILKFVILAALLCCAPAELASSRLHTQNGSRPNAKTSSSKPQLPLPTGTYGVGRVSYAFADPSRPEPLAQKAGAVREVVAEVWYPTEAGLSAHSHTADYLPGFDAAKPKLSQDAINDLFRPATYNGIMPIPIRSRTRRSLAIRKSFQSSSFLTVGETPLSFIPPKLKTLVSHGYVVAAVDHPYDTAFTEFPDGRIALFAQKEFDAATSQPGGFIAYARQRVELMANDNRFVLTQLHRYATSRKLHAPFLYRLDKTHIGAFGHSIGGLVAARTCQIDARVQACIDQDSDDDRALRSSLLTSGKRSNSPSCSLSSSQRTRPARAKLTRMTQRLRA